MISMSNRQSYTSTVSAMLELCDTKQRYREVLDGFCTDLDKAAEDIKAYGNTGEQRMNAIYESGTKEWIVFVKEEEKDLCKRERDRKKEIEGETERDRRNRERNWRKRERERGERERERE